jgi:hypothetical protein
MHKARFTEEQMVAIIREADRKPVSVVGKRHGVSEQTIYTWCKRFGGFQANEVRRRLVRYACSNMMWDWSRSVERISASQGCGSS